MSLCTRTCPYLGHCDLPELSGDVQMRLTSVERHHKSTDDAAEVDVIAWRRARRTRLLDATTAALLRPRRRGRLVAADLKIAGGDLAERTA